MPPNEIPSWLSLRPPQPPTILQHWDGLPSVTLSVIPGGARLLWIFQEDYPDQFGIFVHLEDHEAQQVFKTPSDVGLLEGVRSRLRDRDAFVWRKSRNMFGTESYRIPKRGPEPVFAEGLWSAAEAVELILDIGDAKRRLRAEPRRQRKELPVQRVDSASTRAGLELARVLDLTLTEASAYA